MATRADRKIKPLYIVLGVVVVVALAAMLAVNLSAGGGGDDTAPDRTPPVPAPAAPGPSPTPEALEVIEIFEGKDPFRPLVFESGGDAPASPGTTAPTPVPDVTPGPAAPTQAPGAPPPQTAPPPQSGVRVEVMSVADDSTSATVRVGSRVFENAREGQTLSDGVQIMRIANPCVDFVRDGRAFRLCEGEQVLK